MSRLFVILFLALLAGSGTESVYAEIYNSPCPGEFPIVASTPFNGDEELNRKDLQGIIDCGFNLCKYSSTDERINQLLEYVDGTGLKLLLFTPDFRYNPNEKEEQWSRKIREFVNKYKDNPSLAGWEFKDEPKWNDLPGLRKRYELLKNTDETHFILINLVGMIAKEFTGPCRNLNEYLDSIQKSFDVDVWSSDYYPIKELKGNLSVEYKNYYEDLKAFSLKSKATGIPMWSYCESMEYSTQYYSRPAATLPYLSFQAFSALAYGAQGLVYWTYRLRPSTSYETYHSALVDMEGNKTDAWYAAQNINLQIKALTPVFLGCEMVECIHTGKIGIQGSLPYISRFGPIDRLTAGEKGVLVSHIKNAGRNYLVIVNHDVENSQSVKIKFKAGLRVDKIEAHSGKLNKRQEKKNFNGKISPGGYLIFEWR